MAFSFGGNTAAGGGGGFGGFGATNAAASPFGGGAGTTTSAFGSKPATPGFGGFGNTTATTGGMFGGGATGAPVTGFGAAAASPATGFGAASPASAFGGAAAAPSAFGGGGNAFGGGGGATNAFGGGGVATTGAFGSNAASSPFGKPAGASPFGQTSVFGGGATAQPTSTGFGAAPTATGGAFGSAGAFGSPATSAFGGGGSAFGAAAGKSPFGGGGAFGATPTTSAFGATPATGGFGATATPGGFGAAPAAGGFGGFGAAAAQPQQPQVGTGNPPYKTVRETEGALQSSYISISRMPQYAHKSTEELRFEDYLKRTNPAAAQAAAALNQPTAATTSSSGFGASTTSAFGSSGFGTTTSAFGGAATPATGTTGGAFGSSFGATATPSTGGFGGFGATGNTGGMFGNTTRSVGGFGSTAVSQPMGATGAFGATTTTTGFGAAPATSAGFGSTGSAFGSSFGAPASTPAASTGGFGGFGAATTTPAAGGFGTGAFRKPAAATGGFGGFGATAQPATGATGGFGGFGAAGGAAPTLGGGAFGGASGAATGTSFSFNSTAAKPATSTGFSFGGAGATGGFGTGGGFGTATGGTGAFGSTATPASGAGLFGGGGATGTATSGFGFGSAGTSAAAPATGGMFGSAPKTGGGLFGSSTPSLGGGATGGGMFGSTATGGGTSLFGGTSTGAAKTGFGFGTGGLGAGTSTGTGFGGFGSFGSAGATSTTPSTGFSGGLFGSQAQQASQPGVAGAPAQPSVMLAAPDVNPYGSGAFGAGLVEQNVKAALDLQSLKPTTSSMSRLSTFAQDTGLPRGPLDNPLAARRHLLNSRHSIPVSFIRGSSFKGTKSRFATITSTNGGTAPSALRPASAEPVTGGSTSQDDEFKFSSSLFRKSLAKRLVIDKGDAPSSSSTGGSRGRASVIPLSEDDSTPAKRGPLSARTLQPDDDGTFSIVFRNLANKKNFTLRVKGGNTIAHVREEVKGLLRATMTTTVSDIQLLANGRIVNDAVLVQDLRLKEGEALDVGIVEDLTPSAATASANKPAALNVDKSAVAKPAARLTYAEFMNSALRDDGDEASEVGGRSKPASPSCPLLQNEDYYTVPTYDRLKRMCDEELAQVEGFTVGCKGLGSVSWIGKTDVRYLDLDDLIHFEKKEVIVYKDDEHKHELGTGLNRPAIVELLGIFPPRKTQDGDKYKEKVKQRTRDIGATFLDYSPSKGIWRFRVEHFSRYGFDDDDDKDDEGDVMMDGQAESTGRPRFSEEKKRMTKAAHTGPSVRPVVSNDRVGVVRSSLMYGNRSGGQGAVASFSQGAGLFGRPIGEPEPEVVVTPHGEAQEPMVDESDNDREWEEEKDLRMPPPHVPTSTVYALPPGLTSMLPLGIDRETSLLPRNEKSTTYQMFLQVTNQSVVAKNQVDMGLFLARSFRCSWGPNGELVNLGRLVTATTPSKTGRTATIEFPLQVQVQNSALTKSALNMHYECCQSTDSGARDGEQEEEDTSGTPSTFALPSDDGIVATLQRYVRFSEDARKKHPGSAFHRRAALLWKLVQALWGQEHDMATYDDARFCPLAARDDPREIENMETFQMVDLRREAISKWFETALGSEWSTCDASTPSHVNILQLLCQHRIVEASEMAMECGDFRLATMISQAATYEGSDYRTLLVDQLAQWSDNGTLEYVEEDLVMIYSLLAGSVEVLTAQKTTDQSWLMCLALFFWYKRGPATSLKTALTLYRDAVNKNLARGATSAFVTSQSDKADVLMEVMKLYVEDAVSLCSVLSPSGFAGGRDAHLNYELSWHLHSVLRAIGYRIDRKWESHVQQNYIRQLEGAGLWEEAVYVSLNICDAKEREMTCRTLLYRNADLLQTDVDGVVLRDRICERYLIPIEWVEEALAIAAVSKHLFNEEIAHWIAANRFEEAHDCLVRHVAPTCLFSGEKSVLLQLLLDLEPYADQISQWNACGGDYFVGGGLLLEYLRLQNQEGLDVGREDEYLDRLAQLSDQLSQVGEPTASKSKVHERAIARTALSSMLVALSTQSIQLRAALRTQTMVGADDENMGLPLQLRPDFLSSLAGLSRGRETKFVESYRASQLLSLCSTFVDWRA